MKKLLLSLGTVAAVAAPVASVVACGTAATDAEKDLMIKTGAKITKATAAGFVIQTYHDVPETNQVKLAKDAKATKSEKYLKLYLADGKKDTSVVLMLNGQEIKYTVKVDLTAADITSITKTVDGKAVDAKDVKDTISAAKATGIVLSDGTSPVEKDGKVTQVLTDGTTGQYIDGLDDTEDLGKFLTYNILTKDAAKQVAAANTLFEGLLPAGKTITKLDVAGSDIKGFTVDYVAAISDVKTELDKVLLKVTDKDLIAAVKDLDIDDFKIERVKEGADVPFVDKDKVTFKLKDEAKTEVTLTYTPNADGNGEWVISVAGATPGATGTTPGTAAGTGTPAGTGTATTTFDATAAKAALDKLGATATKTQLEAAITDNGGTGVTVTEATDGTLADTDQIVFKDDKGADKTATNVSAVWTIA